MALGRFQVLLGWVCGVWWSVGVGGGLVWVGLGEK